MTKTADEKRAYARDYYRKNRDQVLSQKAARRAADPEGARERGRKWFKDNPEKTKSYARKGALKNRYGLTPEQYAAMVAEQGSRCAICKTTTPDKKGGAWLVDHCHSTGKVRGLLCRQCNTGLGQFRDNRDFLKEAITYLDLHCGS